MSEDTEGGGSMGAAGEAGERTGRVGVGDCRAEPPVLGAGAGEYFRGRVEKYGV